MGWSVEQKLKAKRREMQKVRNGKISMSDDELEELKQELRSLEEEKKANSYGWFTLGRTYLWNTDTSGSLSDPWTFARFRELSIIWKLICYFCFPFGVLVACTICWEQRKNNDDI